MSISKSGLMKQLQLISLLSNSISLSKLFIDSLPHAKASSKSRYYIVLSLENSFVFRTHIQNQLKKYWFGWKERSLNLKKFETISFHLKFPRFWRHAWKTNLDTYDATFFIFNQFPPPLTDKGRREFWFSTKCMPQEISQQKSQQLFSADFPDMWDTSPCESWVTVTTFKMGDESSQGQKTLWATKFFNFVSPLIRYINIGAAQLCDALNIFRSPI